MGRGGAIAGGVVSIVTGILAFFAAHATLGFRAFGEHYKLDDSNVLVSAGWNCRAYRHFLVLFIFLVSVSNSYAQSGRYRSELYEENNKLYLQGVEIKIVVAKNGYISDETCNLLMFAAIRDSNATASHRDMFFHILERDLYNKTKEHKATADTLKLFLVNMYDERTPKSDANLRHPNGQIYLSKAAQTICKVVNHELGFQVPGIPSKSR